MPDTPAQVRAILQSTFSELARLTDNATVKGVLESIGSAVGPGNGDEPATSAPPSTPAARRPTSSARTPRSTSTSAKGPRSTRGASSSASSQRRSTGAPRARRGGRRDELLAIIRKQPGVTIAEAAAQIGVAATGLYPVARRLASDGLVRKDGTGWRPTDS